ncbi:hypothetical protein BN8_01639 [Fibrisoma limi BUZ 3]|uniref:Uncharacterized protein n=1 Tax=Fibrisoma limi BUZ 3 TaxID=1185876 RepID=I2GFF0_9BACT|nr:hypothetical protein BN8_01639 [Fibrisoma limi BUZ 3]
MAIRLPDLPHPESLPLGFPDYLRYSTIYILRRINPSFSANRSTLNALS